MNEKAIKPVVKGFDNSLGVALHGFAQDVSKIIIEKDRENTFFKGRKYASLESIMKSIHPILDRYNLVLTHRILESNGSYAVNTMVEHAETGKYLQSAFPLFGVDPQKLGICISYGRRYNIAAIFNLTFDDELDDDAESVVTRDDKPAAKPAPARFNKPETKAIETPANPPAQKTLISYKTRDEMVTEIGKFHTVVSLENYATEWARDINNLKLVNIKDYDLVVSTLSARKRLINEKAKPVVTQAELIDDDDLSQEIPF
jgi:hypothetical protein